MTPGPTDAAAVRVGMEVVGAFVNDQGAASESGLL